MVSGDEKYRGGPRRFTNLIGLDFQEECLGISVRVDVVRMLYLDEPRVGNAAYAAARPLRTGNHEPSRHFYYSSGDTNLLMEILRLSMPKAKYDSFPWDVLLRQLGAKETCSCVFSTARTADQCRSDLKNTFPILPAFRVDLVKKTVSAGDKVISRVRYENECFGCRLETSVDAYRE